MVEDLDYEPSDFEYMIAALAYAQVEDLTLEDLTFAIENSSNGSEFDAAVVSLIELKEIRRGLYESIRKGYESFSEGSNEEERQDSPDY